MEKNIKKVGLKTFAGTMAVVLASGISTPAISADDSATIVMVLMPSRTGYR